MSKQINVGSWFRMPSPIFKIEKKHGFACVVGIMAAKPGSRKLNVLAFEIAPLPDGSAADPLQHFFENHSHGVVAENVRTVGEAKEIADSYLRRWKRNRKPDAKLADMCSCGEIDTGKKAA